MASRKRLRLHRVIKIISDFGFREPTRSVRNEKSFAIARACPDGNIAKQRRRAQRARQHEAHQRHQELEVVEPLHENVPPDWDHVLGTGRDRAAVVFDGRPR